MSENLYAIEGSELAKILDDEGNVDIDDVHTEPSYEKKGLHWPRLFGTGDPYDQIKWVYRSAKITKGSGEVVFQQDNVEVPDFWSQTAIDIVASKYFRGRLDAPEREKSVKTMVDRVANTIATWGFKDGYFSSQEDAENYKLDLQYLLVNQFASFNSPVWFNVGQYERPQCSACFILSVDDDLQSIFKWYEQEGWIFKGGSGSGLNVSKLRSSKEPLSRGGFAGGPVSFMKGADGIASAIRSGGTTRRAAKMVVLNVDHPDIHDFINAKKNIEEMTRILESSGIKNSIEAEVFDPYTLLPYQNANNSIRVTDEFMQAVESNSSWSLKAVASGEVLEKHKAEEIMDWISDAAWHSADPGMQYDTTINEWHTCPNTGRINASNPCSEYMHIDNSACNLASLNLLKFAKSDGSYDIASYKKAIKTIITGQEIIVGNSSYPTPEITKNAIDYRELGIGYANLGALLMSLGLAYDSEEGRAIAAALTSILTGESYRTSAEIASLTGPFNGFEKNREPMLKVIKKHGLAAETLLSESGSIRIPHGMSGNGNGVPTDWEEKLFAESVKVWKQALSEGEKYGFRNSQASVLAPTGTICFMMDCATTGVEPELSLVKYKKLVGGGVLKIVNTQIESALLKLGYDATQIKDIANYVLEKGIIENAPHIKDEHLSVFDCSFKSPNGTRSINYLGHVRMMGAVQPFISGAISKTVNLPEDATKEDVLDVFMQSWKLGIKAVAIYRDGSKSVQPMSTSVDTETKDLPGFDTSRGYTRRKLPEERPSITHKFTIAKHEGYLTVGLYPDTKAVGETFITIAKEGSTVSGLLDVVATLVSMCLQSGIPLKELINKFKDMRFEPSGATSNPHIPFAKSFIDYIFRYLGYRYLNAEDQEEIFGTASPYVQPTLIDLNIGNLSHSTSDQDTTDVNDRNSNEPLHDHHIKLVSEKVGNGSLSDDVPATDAPVCECGTIMFRAGSCFSCPNCFATTGVCN